MSCTSNKTFAKTGFPCSIALALCIAIAGTPRNVGADTLELRNGQRFENVKTTVRGGRIYVTEQNGRTRSFPAKQVGAIIPSAVNWPEAPKKAEPVAPKTTPEVKPKEEKASPKVENKAEHPAEKPSTAGSLRSAMAWSMAEGMVPLWSGLYRRDRFTLGAMFTTLELYAIARLAPWLRPPEPWQQSSLQQVGVLSFLVLPPGAPQPPPGSIPPFNGNFFRDTYFLIATQNLVEHPLRAQRMKQGDFDRTRALRMVGLALVLAADAFCSAFCESGPKAKTASAAGGPAAAEMPDFSWTILPGVPTGEGAARKQADIHLSFSWSF